MSDAIEREEELFIQVLTVEKPARAAFLAAACGGDAELCRRVEQLLVAHDAAGSMLDAPPATCVAASQILPEEKPGDLIGRYKLLQKIGEGGCGVVYMAEQEEPVRRRVALKVIKLGMDTKEVIARFEAERQALALMDHPNIAKVLDAGATATGRPYFVMELVRGIPLTKYCDEHNATTAERLELFIQICHAVQHAHQKGIIHRDLKPSNILVTINDGLAVPKVIDFGIAKATQGRLTDKTVFTAFEQFIGTPAYMSPEQAVMTSLDIDTRSDIYSLGVLLYELLTGRTPFDAKELREAGLDEIRRHIREVEPPKPSTRLSTMEGAALTTTARLRHTDAPKLLTLIRGDLDWIVMRCLEKDRTRRYDTANGLAEDIRRHLADEPVTASPPSAAYRFQKLVRRNRVAFAAATAIAAALVLGAAIATWQAVRATRAEHRAQAERKLAEQRRTEVETIHKLILSDTLASADPENSRGRDITVRAVLDDAALRIPHAFANNPLLEAAIRATVGETYGKLGVMDKAEAHLQAALATRRRLLGEEHPDTLAVLRTLGALYLINLRGVDAEPLVTRVLAIQERTLGSDHEETLKTLNEFCNAKNLAAQKMRPAAEWQRVTVEFETFARATYERVQRRLGPEHPATLVARQNLMCGCLFAGRYFPEKRAEADKISAELLTARRRVLGLDHPDTLETMYDRAGLLMGRGAFAEGEKLARECIEIKERVFGAEHWSTALSLRTLGIHLRLQGGRGDEASALFKRAALGFVKSFGPENQMSVGTLNRLATCWFECGRGDEAARFAEEQLADFRRRLPAGSPTIRMLLYMLGSARLLQGRPAEAAATLRECLALWEQSKADDWHPCNALSLLGGALLAEKKFAEAEPLLVAGYEGMKQREATMDSFYKPQLWFALSRLVQLYTAWGQPAKAGEWQKKLAVAVPPPARRAPQARPPPVAESVLKAKAPTNLGFDMPAGKAGAAQITVTVPAPWRTSGPAQAANYVGGVDRTQPHRQPASAYIKSIQSSGTAIGSVAQGFAAEDYRNRRVRFSAWIKADAVEKGAQLWLRFDRQDGGVILIDNMGDRPIKGTAPWTPAAIVMDVPTEAAAIAIGFFLNGPGQMWVNDAQFEVVGADVPVTKAPAKTTTSTGK